MHPALLFEPACNSSSGLVARVARVVQPDECLLSLTPSATIFAATVSEADPAIPLRRIASIR